MFYNNIRINILLACIIFVTGFLGGCGAKEIPTTDIYSTGVPVRLIALMPVENKTGDEEAARLLRRELLEKIYFKGYPKIPLDSIDTRMTKIYSEYGSYVNVDPEVAGVLLDVDAVLYCILEEWETSYAYVRATTKVAASFELRSADRGRIIWKNRYEVNKDHYGFTKKHLAMKSLQAYEPAVQELIEHVMKAFPNGPDYVETLPLASEKGYLWGLF